MDRCNGKLIVRSRCYTAQRAVPSGSALFQPMNKERRIYRSQHGSAISHLGGLNCGVLSLEARLSGFTCIRPLASIKWVLLSVQFCCVHELWCRPFVFRLVIWWCVVPVILSISRLKWTVVFPIPSLVRPTVADNAATTTRITARRWATLGRTHIVSGWSGQSKMSRHCILHYHNLRIFFDSGWRGTLEFWPYSLNVKR